MSICCDDGIWDGFGIKFVTYFCTFIFIVSSVCKELVFEIKEGTHGEELAHVNWIKKALPVPLKMSDTLTKLYLTH